MWKSLWYVHSEFSYESLGGGSLKIGPHLPKLLSNIKQLTFLEHGVELCPRVREVAVLTYKVLHGCAPSYLGPFVRVADLPSRRALRSANTSRLIQPQSNRATVGDRAFPVAGPQVWNSLPPEVTSAPSLDTFRKRLKTHLFTVSYSNIQLS